MPVAEARDRDTALLDLVQRVQLDAGKADVSMVANFNPDARVPMGDVQVRDIAGLYVYDNTLVVIQVTGQQMKDALEHSARFFDGGVPLYNYDQAEGVTYELDLTKPAGQRIQNLRFQGQPLGPAQKLRLATNNLSSSSSGWSSIARFQRNPPATGAWWCQKVRSKK